MQKISLIKIPLFLILLGPKMLLICSDSWHFFDLKTAHLIDVYKFETSFVKWPQSNRASSFFFFLISIINDTWNHDGVKLSLPRPSWSKLLGRAARVQYLLDDIHINVTFQCSAQLSDRAANSALLHLPLIQHLVHHLGEAIAGIVMANGIDFHTR